MVEEKAREVKFMLSEDNDSVNQMLSLPVAAFVQAAYDKLLGRFPDPHELKSNIGAIRCGLGRVHFLDNIHKSDEFHTRFQKMINEGSDSAFVSRAFAMYLKRKPDPQGLEHYLEFLQKGKSREIVNHDIANSKEAKKSYTFWYELDRLLNDQRNSGHPIKRWIGKNRRQERKINREFEIIQNIMLLNYSNNSQILLNGNFEQQDISKFDANSKYSSHVSHSPSLFAKGQGELSSAARKILSRFQHASALYSNRTNS